MARKLRDSLPAEPPRLRLAHLPTPIQPLRKLPASAAIPRVDIKRDDLTGVLLSGNKVRKLEFLLAEAQQERATCVITCGGIQSNHARATAAAASRLGLRTVLLLSGSAPARPEGNLLLDHLLGAEVRFISAEEYLRRDKLLAEIAAQLRADGERPYVIPEGGSNAIGAWGYVAAVRELYQQEPALPWSAIVCATGSGGTHAGLLIGSRLLGLDLHVRSYLVHRTRDYFVEEVRGIVSEFEQRFPCATGIHAEDIDIVAGYEGPAYAEPYPAEIDLIRELAREEGILLDPVYTGKAFTGLISEIGAGQYGSRDRVLFLHTGGIYGLMAQGERILGAT